MASSPLALLIMHSDGFAPRPAYIPDTICPNTVSCNSGYPTFILHCWLSNNEKKSSAPSKMSTPALMLNFGSANFTLRGTCQSRMSIFWLGNIAGILAIMRQTTDVSKGRVRERSFTVTDSVTRTLPGPIPATSVFVLVRRSRNLVATASEIKLH
uniref:(northern house mosquito) hypothetical protein n=1 Tax=Culex pipiens TaxID=7175 RepID=A0A8D8AMK3_CULPI